MKPKVNRRVDPLVLHRGPCQRNPISPALYASEISLTILGNRGRRGEKRAPAEESRAKVLVGSLERISQMIFASIVETDTKRCTLNRHHSSVIADVSAELVLVFCSHGHTLAVFDTYLGLELFQSWDRQAEEGSEGASKARLPSCQVAAFGAIPLCDGSRPARRIGGPNDKHTIQEASGPKKQVSGIQHFDPEGHDEVPQHDRGQD